MTTYQEFMNWKQDPVTVKFFKDIQYRLEEIKEVLLEQAGKNPDDDNFYRGYGKACQDFLAIEFVEEED